MQSFGGFERRLFCGAKSAPQTDKHRETYLWKGLRCKKCTINSRGQEKAADEVKRYIELKKVIFAPNHKIIAKRFGSFMNCSYLCTRNPPRMNNTWVSCERATTAKMVE